MARRDSSRRTRRGNVGVSFYDEDLDVGRDLRDSQLRRADRGDPPAGSGTGSTANGPRRMLEFKTAHQRNTERPASVDWVIRNIAAVGVITELDGTQKLSGKTTLIAFAVRAKLDGLPFLGQPTAAGPVVWLTEESWATLQEPLREAGLLDRDDLHILCREDAFGVTWEEVARQAREKVLDVGANLVIADTLSSLAGLKGDEENSSGGAAAAMRPVHELVSAGVAVWLTRHDRRAGGEVGESGRGSTGFAGAADMIFRLARLGGDGRASLRKLEYVGRVRGVPDSLIVELTDTGYAAVGTTADMKRQEARSLLLEHLPDSEDLAVTLPTLWTTEDKTKDRPAGPLAGSKIGKTTWRETAETLLAEGLLGRRQINAQKQVWWCVSGARGSGGHTLTMSGGDPGDGCVSGGPSPLRDGHTETDAAAPDVDPVSPMTLAALDTFPGSRITGGAHV